MKKQILVDITEEETRVAIMEGDKLAELFIERSDERSIVGDIYFGKVQNIVEGINSAFVDIGREKNAFLPLDEIPSPQEAEKGKDVLVQVTKDALGSKGPKLTAQISLPGRYLVYTPFSSRIGVSRQIRDFEERTRLLEALRSVVSSHEGFIIRTEAEGCSKKDIIRDYRYLIKLWKKIKGVSWKPNKRLIHMAFGPVFYVVREIFNDEVDSLVINSSREYKDVLSYAKMVIPGLAKRIKLYKKDRPLFEEYHLEKQIQRIPESTVFLPSGGTIVIEQTEALTAIDVNTGSFTGERNRERTAFLTNREAAEEIVRQLRLRNIGGIIIVDFVDMKERKNRDQLMRALHQLLRKDRAKVTVLPLTRLGLLEMTRERKRDSLVNLICQDCPYCQGSGLVLSEKTMFIKIKKEILRRAKEFTSHSLNIFMNPRVATLFDEAKVRELSSKIKKNIRIRADYKLHHHDFEITI